MSSGAATRTRVRPGVALAFLRAARPHQWVKNLLVFSVPAAAEALGRSPVLVDALLAFAAFCLVSSGTYLLNDASDVEADRLHPTKRNRPVAAGDLSVRAAVVGGVLLLAAGLAVAAVGALGLLAVVAAYVVLTTAYTRWLKHIAVLDIAAVAAGFVLRAVAVGVASDLYMSRWFLIVAGSGSLFVITGKRYAEVMSRGTEAFRTRAALAGYTPEYLRAMLTTTAAVIVLAYCLWALEEDRFGETPSDWRAASAVPFVLGIMRYGLLVDRGNGEDPVGTLARDRVLLGLGAVWLGMILLSAVV